MLAINGKCTIIWRSVFAECISHVIQCQVPFFLRCYVLAWSMVQWTTGSVSMGNDLNAAQSSHSPVAVPLAVFSSTVIFLFNTPAVSTAHTSMDPPASPTVKSLCCKLTLASGRLKRDLRANHFVAIPETTTCLVSYHHHATTCFHEAYYLALYWYWIVDAKTLDYKGCF